MTMATSAFSPASPAIMRTAPAEARAVPRKAGARKAEVEESMNAKAASDVARASIMLIWARVKPLCAVMDGW